MSSDTYFPVKFLTAGNKVEEGTTPGLYLRWFVQPYLGVPGISPLDTAHIAEGEPLGFRLFYHAESGLDQPPLTPIPLDPILPKEPEVDISDVHDRPTWKGTHHPGGANHIVQLDLSAQYLFDICYLRFSYAQFKAHTLQLQYAIHSANSGQTTQHDIPLHYELLAERLEEGAVEYLTYAIQVENDDESITSLTLISDGSLLFGDFFYAGQADLPYYVWSPPGGADAWVEIPPQMYGLEPPKEPITAVGDGDMIEILNAFYETYYGVGAQQADSNHILFHHPATPGFQLDLPLVREYYAGQYADFLRGKYEEEAGTEFYISPQDAAALAANDPAIAYLFGLFRWLNWGDVSEDARLYKVQGEWPDGRRFCIYSACNTARELVRPRISTLKAQELPGDYVLYDYATFRNHSPLNTCDLSWQVKKGIANAPLANILFDPAAYLVLRGKTGSPLATYLSPFYLPRDEDVDAQGVHYVDWRDRYPQTDINKVLDGRYQYHISGFDIFGQMSDWIDDNEAVDPLPLHMGEVHKPLITLLNPQTPLENDPGAIEIPLEATKTSSGYRLKAFNSDQIRFSYSFIWPLQSRYIWNENRASQQLSLDYFRLLYMVDTPQFALTPLRIVDNTASGIRVTLAGVSSTGANADLYALLDKLGAVDTAGTLVPSMVDLALLGGILFIGRNFKVTKVTVTTATATVELMLLPADGTKKDSIEQSGYVLPQSISEQMKDVINGRLYWNKEARSGGGYLGWKTLSDANEQITPTPPVDINVALVDEIAAPNSATGTPVDLQPAASLIAYETPAAEGNYGFTIRLAANDPLCDHERFQFIALDPTSGLEPGEHLRAALPAVEQTAVPLDATQLFTPERIFAFYASRIGDDAQNPGQVLYRGEPLAFTSQAGNTEKEYILFPDITHTNWRVIVPETSIRHLPLAEFLSGRTFNDDHYLTTALAVAVEAVSSGLDAEVQDSMQSAVAEKKLSIEEYLPPPVLTLPDPPQPAFGTPASPPGYDGQSLISVKTIFAGSDLKNKLTTQQQYVPYRLPAGRVLPGGFTVEYAEIPTGGKIYMRNMVALKTRLDALKTQAGAADYLSIPALQKLFADYSEKVDDALDKEDLLKLPVSLPGEAQTVFFYALKAYDKQSGKESNAFTCLSKPVYVEDVTPPEKPVIESSKITVNNGKLDFEFTISRKLDPVSGYGHVTQAELSASTALLGPYFPHLVRDYRLYAGNRSDVIMNADDADFLTTPSANTIIGGSGRAFSIKLMPAALTLTTLDSTTAKVSGSVTFSDIQGLENMPAELHVCLRAYNYLGSPSDLVFTPMTYHTALPAP